LPSYDERAEFANKGYWLSPKIYEDEVLERAKTAMVTIDSTVEEPATIQAIAQLAMKPLLGKIPTKLWKSLFTKEGGVGLWESKILKITANQVQERIRDCL
jgi:hypothetical protein